MKPIGPLMHEHRLIERTLNLIDAQCVWMEKEKCINAVAIDTIVDCIRTYADRTHHGKEEGILFRDLQKKSLSDEHARITRELIEEHRQARVMVGAIVKAKTAYLAGDKEALSTILTNFQNLARFYPKHIEKEDKHFFFPILDYFSKEEQDAMLREFNEFDSKMIHEKYTQVVEELERSCMSPREIQTEYQTIQNDISQKIYRCKVCGYRYDPSKGDPKGHIPPGTQFEVLPSNWVCPVCGAAKEQFIIV